KITRVDTKANTRASVITNLNAPEGIALAPNGRLIVAEVGRKRALSVNPSTGAAEVLAEHLAIGLGGGPQAPRPYLPTGVTVTRDGAIFVAGDIDNTIYRLTAK